MYITYTLETDNETYKSKSGQGTREAKFTMLDKMSQREKDSLQTGRLSYNSKKKNLIYWKVPFWHQEKYLFAQNENKEKFGGLFLTQSFIEIFKVVFVLATQIKQWETI